MARVAVLCPDLLFGSKLQSALAAAGHEVLPVGLPGRPGGRRPHRRTRRAHRGHRGRDGAALGFYSHVQQDVRRRAEEAGFALVVPRSRMARETARGGAGAHVDGPRSQCVTAGGCSAGRVSATARPLGPRELRRCATARERFATSGRSRRMPKRASKSAQPSSAARSRRSGGTSAGAIASSWARMRSSSAAAARATSATVGVAVGERGAGAVGERGDRRRRPARGARAACARSWPPPARGSAARRSGRRGTRACRTPRVAQRDALDVPERDDRVDLAGDQARHRREADRRAAHPVVVAAVVLDHRAQHGVVGGQAGDADALALELRAGARSPCRAITAASGRCTSAPTPTTSAPRSRASPRSWMSTIERSARPLASSFSESVEAPGTRTRRSRPWRGVEVLAQRRVDAGVGGVGLEVEGQRRRAAAVGPPPTAVVVAAGAERRATRTTAKSVKGAERKRRSLRMELA